MIDEAIGKILGMAMAYAASVMGMLVAYVNYRKRIVKADKVMTPAAWAVVTVSLLAVGVGVLTVVQLATAPAGPAAQETAVAHEAIAEPEPPADAGAAVVAEERSRWPLVGMLVPAVIFLFATVVTAGLHRHFSGSGP